MKDKLFAAFILVALLGGSWLIGERNKNRIDETMYIRYHH
jgi:hypothetical protein